MSKEQFSHLLHAGIVPSNEEYTAIFAAKKEYEGQRTKLQKEIFSLKARLKEAQKELETAQNEIDRHAQLISPLRRMPPALLKDIFALAAPATDSLPITDIVLHPPWTLLQVCKHWNEVCLMYGSLWSKLNINTSSIVSYNYEEPLVRELVGEHPEQPNPIARGPSRESPFLTARGVEILETQLQRSQDADLSVTIRTMAKVDYAQPFLRAILPHLHRAKHLKIPYHIFADLALPLDRLDHLEIDYSFDREFESPPVVDPTQAPLPHPHQTFAITLMSACRRHPMQTPLSIYRPDLLTRVGLESTCWDALKLLLPQMKSLTELQLFGVSDRSAFAYELFQNLPLFPGHPGGLLQPPQEPVHEGPAPRIELSKLSKLTISRLAGMPQPLDSIQAPNLESLAFTGPLEKFELVEFLSASACELHKLKLHPNMELVSFLQLVIEHTNLFATVRELELAPRSDGARTGGYMAAALGTQATPVTTMTEEDGVHIVSAFTNSTDSIIFPQLRDLVLRHMSVPVTVINDMLQARRSPELDVQLASFTLTDLLSEHRRWNPEELKQTLAARSVKLHAIDSQSGGDPAWSYPRLGTSGARLGRFFSGEHMNQRLSFSEGLEREPKEKARLEKIQEGGLELYMNQYWNQTLRRMPIAM